MVALSQKKNERKFEYGTEYIHVYKSWMCAKQLYSSDVSLRMSHYDPSRLLFIGNETNGE